MPPSNTQARIGFGGGCHWCTEAVFAALKGVDQVHQGFVSSDPPDDSWSEAVDLVFDPDVIALEELIDIHLNTHACTSDHSMRGKYRSAVYAHSKEDAQRFSHALADLAKGFGAPLVTRVLMFRGFRASDPRYQNYHAKHADGPFCQRYIEPKLDRLKSHFAGALKID